MTVEDPISGNKYEETIEGVKQWGATELDHGLPLVYAFMGFTINLLLGMAILVVVNFLVGFSVPGWVGVVVLVWSVFSAFGGWKHGEKEQQEIDVETEETELIDPNE